MFRIPCAVEDFIQGISFRTGVSPIYLIGQLIDFLSQDDHSPNGYSRYGHTCTCMQNSTVICHAGAQRLNATVQSILTRDTYIFNPTTNHFSRVEPNPKMDIRLFHAVAYVEQADLLYMYGGYTHIYGPTAPPLKDLWTTDPNVPGKKGKNMNRRHTDDILPRSN